jgi:phosphatidate phosphatase APP1
MKKRIKIKLYHGFGHTHDIILFGHVFKRTVRLREDYRGGAVSNFFWLLRLFFVTPVKNIPVVVNWEGQQIATISEFDGFFRAEWKSTKPTSAGWHDVSASSPFAGEIQRAAPGKIFIPHSTQYGFISDIDDTILISHSATIWKRLKELLFRNPHTREIFPGVAEHYKLLSMAHTTKEAPNPFFYISSSEWNLYDYLRELFTFHQLPNGAFLLNQVKRWFELVKTGKTKHTGKLLRIVRVLEIFPQQTFVLFGDNSQSDPAIYAKLAEKYADRIHAVYIRNVSEKNEALSKQLLQSLTERGIHTILFSDSNEAIAHSKKIGLI